MEIILVGDFNQWPTPEKRALNYKHQYFIHKMVDFHSHTLTEQHRYDGEMKDTMRKFKVLDYPFQTKGETKFNVCFTNRQRKKLNTELSLRYKGPKAFQTRKGLFSVGCLVICKKNRSGFNNNELFEIVERGGGVEGAPRPVVRAGLLRHHSLLPRHHDK